MTFNYVCNIATLVKSLFNCLGFISGPFNSIVLLQAHVLEHKSTAQKKRQRLAFHNCGTG